MSRGANWLDGALLTRLRANGQRTRLCPHRPRSRGCPCDRFPQWRTGGLCAARPPFIPLWRERSWRRALRESFMDWASISLSRKPVSASSTRGEPYDLCPARPCPSGYRLFCSCMTGWTVDGRDPGDTGSLVPALADGRFANRPYGPTKPCPSGYRAFAEYDGVGVDGRNRVCTSARVPLSRGRAIRESPLRPHQALPLWIPAFAGMTGRVGAGRRRWLVLGVPRPLARSYPSRASGRALREPQDGPFDFPQHERAPTRGAPTVRQHRPAHALRPLSMHTCTFPIPAFAGMGRVRM